MCGAVRRFVINRAVPRVHGVGLTTGDKYQGTGVTQDQSGRNVRAGRAFAFCKTVGAPPPLNQARRLTEGTVKSPDMGRSNYREMPYHLS